MSFEYNPSTYNTKSAKEIVPLVIELLQPKSVIDIGCGNGTWLSVFSKMGATDILGLDMNEYSLRKFYIKEEQYRKCDLTKAFRLDRKYDLVLCLEVAEHLPNDRADNLIASLSYLGDNILFSAAIPEQGGTNHLNEQYPTYWQEKFARYGFKFYDLLRKRIWENQNIEWWYRQNIFIVSRLNLDEDFVENILPIIHPEMLLYYKNQYKEANRYIESITDGKIGIQESLKILRKAVARKIYKDKNK